jgi:hypothetical protein
MYRVFSTAQIRGWLAQRQPQYIIAVAALLLLFFDTFIKSLSAVALGLTVLALSPWLIKILKTLEMAGIKVEFREQLAQITERAEDAGLLSEPDQRLGTQETYESIYNSDPTLALAGLRIELERRLGELATVSGLKGGPPRRGVGQLIRILSDEGVLDRDEASVIADLLPLMNKAVHSEEYSQEAAGWAIRVGPELLAAIDRKIAEKKQGKAQ